MKCSGAIDFYQWLCTIKNDKYTRLITVSSTTQTPWIHHCAVQGNWNNFITCRRNWDSHFHLNEVTDTFHVCKQFLLSLTISLFFFTLSSISVFWKHDILEVYSAFVFRQRCVSLNNLDIGQSQNKKKVDCGVSESHTIVKTLQFWILLWFLESV